MRKGRSIAWHLAAIRMSLGQVLVDDSHRLKKSWKVGKINFSKHNSYVCVCMSYILGIIVFYACKGHIWQ